MKWNCFGSADCASVRKCEKFSAQVSFKGIRGCAVDNTVILSVLDPRKCEYLKDYSLDFEHAYMTAYLAS